MPPEEATVQNEGSGGAEGTTTQQQSTQQSTTEETGAAWRNMIPAEFREDPALKDYKDFGSFVKSHVHLNKLLGAEPRVPPKDAPPDAWSKFYSALGRPDTPDQYAITPPEGREVNGKLLEGFRRAAHEIGLSSSQATKLAEWHFGAISEEEDAIAAEIAASTERAERELRREYGKAYDNNVRLAQKFAKDMGGDELVSWLDNSGEGSNPLVVRAFVKAARAMSEDRLGSSRSSDFGYTPAEAQSEIGRLRMNKEFTAAYYDSEHAGHRAAVEKMRDLHNAAFPTEDKG